MAQLGEMKRFECGGNCDCGRMLEIHRSTAGFHLTLIDPDFEADEVLGLDELGARVAEAEGAELWVYGDNGNEGSIVITDGQLADLRAWALGEVAA